MVLLVVVLLLTVMAAQISVLWAPLTVVKSVMGWMVLEAVVGAVAHRGTTRSDDVYIC